MTIFDLFDFVSSNILLPLGGMVISIFAGWIIDRRTVAEQLSPTSKFLRSIIVFSLRFIAPLAILAVFINNLL